MGMNMNALSNVEEVIIKTAEKQIIIEQPEVSILDMQGQKIFQVVGGEITETTEKTSSVSVTPKEDIKLVADQTGKSLEEAKSALKECDGDLAKAILLLQS